MLKSVLACLLPCSICAIGFAGTTYYVAPTGSDKNAGTSEQPFATIQKAADLVNPGDIVIVRDGVYTGEKGRQWTNIVSITRGGTADQPVVFKSEHKWGAVLDGQSNGTGYGFVFSGRKNGNLSYVTIQDFEIKDTCYHGITVGGEHNRIVGNLIHRIGVDAAVPHGSEGCGVLESGRDNWFDGNVIHDVPGHCLYICGDEGRIINNLFYDFGRAHTISGYGVQVAGYTTVDGLVISNNTFAWGGHNAGIVIWRALGYNTGEAGIRNLTIQNNIFYRPPIGTSAIDAPADDKAMKNIVIRNNLLSASVGGQTLCTPGHSKVIEERDNTIIHNWDPDPFVDMGNPKVADLSRKLLYDFHLTPKSIAIGKGIADLAPDHDYDGRPRPKGKAVDVGAFQH